MGLRHSTSKEERHFLMEAYNLTDKQFNKIRALFKKMAGVKSFLNLSDFTKLYSESCFQHSQQDLAAVFRWFAEPNSQKLKLAGFVKLCAMCNTGAGGCVKEADKMQVLFDVIDTDGNGDISYSEFTSFVSKFVDDEKAVTHVFHDVDEDASRTIDFREFQLFCVKHRRIYESMCAWLFPIE